MTAACREQYPLLHEDLSEEEHFTQRRGRMAVRSRVRNKVNGAAFVFKRWPGYWSAALTYLWIGLGMIVIITLLIYNGRTVFAMMPSGREAPFHIVNKHIEKSFAGRPSSLPDIFMHVHVEIGNKFDFDKYIPYIEILSNQYNKYNFHLIIVVNDMYTTIDNVFSAEESKFNDIALNNILDNSDGHQKRNVNGLFIDQISLTKYLDSSPLKKHWRHIPNNFIEFLVRAVSIWDKGGISFDPIILTPYSPHFIYMEKLHATLKKYMNESYSENESQNLKQLNNKDNVKAQKLNNIRDIIDAMEQNDGNDVMKENIELISLETAESRFINPVILNILNDTKMVLNKISNSFLRNEKPNNTGKLISPESEKVTFNSQNDDIDRVNKILETNTSTTKSVLSSLNLLSGNRSKVNENRTAKNLARKRKSVIERNQGPSYKKANKENVLIDDKELNDAYKPMIVPANMTSNDTLKAEKNENMNNNKYLDQLTIDLKGNILATKTSCHAFIGTLFSNVMHHEIVESISEFIIRELSLFCKGLLLSCNGIDVIFI